ncbi:hybrid sensor histidine kinase/response regulator [Spirosoma flavum]|uniref:histidine kinase n=1 Tax=Spirosoma flavum TaxID=2048557 RepID=A0ABW6ARB8_9BACT
MATQLLLIEDDAQIRHNVTELLSLSGFRIATADNGREGITQALLSPPDLILCDIMMPDVNGYQVLETLRGIPSLATVPFIFLTAKTNPMDMRQGMLLGADDYLTKPFSIDGLLGAIDTRLHREAARKADLQVKLQAHRRTIGQLSAHEYNTPLSGIIGLTTLLLENDGDFDAAQHRSILTMIKASGQRLKRSLDKQQLMALLEQLDSTHAAYPSYSTGQAVIDAESVEKQVLLVKQWQDCPVVAQCDVASARVGLSSENLALILTEVLDNAFKFSDGSGPIRIKGHRQGQAYHLRISNQGQPFTQADIDQIEPYRQFNRHHYEQQGFGLGLSIVKKLLTLHEGILQLDGDPSGETILTLILPIALPDGSV